MSGFVVDAAALAVKIESATRTLAAAESRREGLVRTLAERELTAGLAKGRLAMKPRVEAFLEGLQEEANKKGVSSYEKLLNRLVDEVFPDQRPERRRVVLDLYAERGLPALDILVESDGTKDNREDLFEDNGGALTNVVSMGLRLIAAVKSGTARFVLLDEADCWIEPKPGEGYARVEAFYKVLNGSANHLDVQCLVISHHDQSRFGDGIHATRLQGFPKKGGVRISGAAPPEWPDERAGFRYMRLVNVQGYVDVTVPLSPGVTVISGPNGRGKSTVTRAWRAVFYNEGRASLIRHGEKQATVELGVAGGRFLRYSRARKRNPIQMWSLHEADGSVVEANGTRYEGSTCEWVGDMFGIRLVQDLQVHLSHQKKNPVFLLAEPAAKRAAVLSIGQESSYISDMQAIFKERCKKDQETVREGERFVGETRAAIAGMDGIEGLAARVEAHRADAAAIVGAQAALAKMAALAARLETALSTLTLARRRLATLAALPAADAPSALESRLRADARRGLAMDRLAAAADGLARSMARRAALAGLPQAEPPIADTESMLRVGRRMKDAMDGFESSTALADLLAALPPTPRVEDTELAESIRARVANAEAGLAASRRRAALLSGLPPAPAVENTEFAESIRARIANAEGGLAALRSRAALLARLPATPPVARTDRMISLGEAISNARRGIEAAATRASAAAEKMAAVKAEVDALLLESGGACMTCGQPVADGSMLLEGHGH